MKNQYNSYMYKQSWIKYFFSDIVMTMEYGPALCTTIFLLKRNKSTRIIYDPINDIIEDKRT